MNEQRTFREKVAIRIGMFLWWISASAITVGTALAIGYLSVTFPKVNFGLIATPLVAVGVIVGLLVHRLIWGKGV